ncbi:MAG: hypothetical protein RR068_15465, partial [Hafnia sp.]
IIQPTEPEDSYLPSGFCFIPVSYYAACALAALVNPSHAMFCSATYRPECRVCIEELLPLPDSVSIWVNL